MIHGVVVLFYDQHLVENLKEIDHKKDLAFTFR